MIAQHVVTNGRCTNCNDFPMGTWAVIQHQDNNGEHLGYYCPKPECWGAETAAWEARHA